eukprot:CAMPEP_0113311610 /NCGR_PEP_ID=MMETSP0010_2-20120614/8775_1 /TAXON_ID=216773 ORGANISM="Corethron hystrix, Strain 308" /NCGR_SAMPLE_ID=MMETSP0010_2 /ASSEMBLY_ACC=CAM_ASM_000155 /LENGTH=479 /DNA_ID=CAMNT_0000167277 /DNA_START=361 /DNA_END=1797 /DNA_ORIENTATION=- /assembly_acc=CAM_ASM_000155
MTQSLLRASDARLEELEDQKEEAQRELNDLRRQLQTPMKRQLSLSDMVSFYREQMNIPDEDRQDQFEKCARLENIIDTIDNEILRATEEKEKMKDSLAKLEKDISAMEKSLEQEKVEKVNIMAEYERERHDILRKQENEAKESASKVAILQQKLSEAHARSDSIVKKYQEKGYEKKIENLQNDLLDMKRKLNKTQSDLSEKLKISQNTLEATLKLNQEDEQKIQTYVKQIGVFKEALAKSEQGVKEKEEVMNENLAMRKAEIEKLTEILQQKNYEMNEMEKKVIVSEYTVESLKKERSEKDKTIQSKGELITSLENEVKSLRREMVEKDKEAERKLGALRIEMMERITTAEVTARAQIKTCEEKMENLKISNESALKKKDDMIAALQTERDAMQTKRISDEKANNMRLDILRQEMALKMKEAEEAANLSLEEASRKLQELKADNERTLAEKDNLIVYLEGCTKKPKEKEKKRKVRRSVW